MSKETEPDQDWHKTFVRKAREITGCSHEAAFEILGLVVDLRESSQQQGYTRGFNAAYKEQGRVMSKLTWIRKRTRYYEKFYGPYENDPAISRRVYLECAIEDYKMKEGIHETV